jgi:uncharacterized repeat protein (TIGR03803 family)
VIRDASGNLYGTTVYGGSGTQCDTGCGVVFKVDRSGKETVLYSFSGGTDGSEPYGGVIEDASGNLYGTTFEGGAHKKGTVFKLDTNGKETVLHSFKGGRKDGSYPMAGLIQDTSGNLYGTTAYGGSGTPCGGEGGGGGGTVFKLTSTGEETVLHGFGGKKDGSCPAAGVIQDAQGNLYGTTSSGYYYVGTVFRLTPSKKGSWKETVLYGFTGGSDGSEPYGGVVRDTQGNLYGTTLRGGTGVCETGGQNVGCGTVFEVDTGGSETVLYNFTGGSDGAWPSAGLLQGGNESFYGTTLNGGDLSDCQSGGPPYGCGVVFELAPN